MKYKLTVMAVLVALLLAACAPSASLPGRAVDTPDGSYRLLTTAELHSMLATKNFTLVNVHIPYEGELEQTDLFIPYDQIQDYLTELPAKDAPIVLYCKSGPMSKLAAEELVSLGYTRVYDVEGGFSAWQAAGYPLLNQEQ